MKISGLLAVQEKINVCTYYFFKMQIKIEKKKCLNCDYT